MEMISKPEVIGDVLGGGERIKGPENRTFQPRKRAEMTPTERMHMLRGCNLKDDCYGVPLKQPPESSLKPNLTPFEPKEYVSVLTKNRKSAKQIKNFNQAVNVPKEEFPMFGAQSGKWALNSYMQQASDNHVEAVAARDNIKRINHGIHGFGFLYHDIQSNEKVNTEPRMQKLVTMREGFHGAEKAPGANYSIYQKWGKINRFRDRSQCNVDMSMPEKPPGMNEWKHKYRMPEEVYNKALSRHDADWRAVKEACMKVNSKFRANTPGDQPEVIRPIGGLRTHPQW
eukprot:CAMPEP_0118932728 /NCGR_PEP_ID=MMETSP1169-20130426/10589_1 /TAXON_ID=36882 /ORGANISM="Pyramimonas obovata, Strain CCMP722" /LENGTH=284 /DNA_ID=CAMNT_0006875425 /DNA_START=134 /DNA_END=985 /DNA_ORIENTATION=+